MDGWMCGDGWIVMDGWLVGDGMVIYRKWEGGGGESPSLISLPAAVTRMMMTVGVAAGLQVAVVGVEEPTERG